MTKFRLYETKKLHYKTYLYKVGLRNSLSHIFRSELQKNGKLSYARERLDQIHAVFQPGQQLVKIPYRVWNDDRVRVEDYYDAITAYRFLKRVDDYKIRVENNYMYVYSNNRKLLMTLINHMRVSAVEFWEPDPLNVDILLSNSNIEIIKKPSLYEFKVTLGGKKGSPSLAKWIESNPNLAKMGKRVREYCHESGYVKGLYFYIRDPKSLLIAQMMVGDNIQRIDRLVYQTQ